MRSFPKGGKLPDLPSREPNKCCAYYFLLYFEIIFPFTSQRLIDHLRKIEVKSKLNHNSKGAPHVTGSKRNGPMWEEEVRQSLLVLAYTWRKRFTLCWPRAGAPGTPVPNPPQRREPALSHILTDVCLCPHTHSVSVPCVLCVN